jgi:ABC-2 type transport system ATP-binding protein
MIQINQLTYSYAKNKTVLNDISLEWTAGRITGLLGMNGIGKTTLLKLLAGWLHTQESKTANTPICISGFTPKARDLEFLQRSYFVPEQSDALGCSGKTYKALHAPLYPNFSESAWQIAVDEFSLDLNEKLKNLSAGWFKKFNLAFALATQCSLILMDEPTNALDIPGKEQFRKLLASITTDEQTIIISTHQVRDLQQSIDSIWLLDHQELLAIKLEEHDQLEQQSLETTFNDFHKDKAAFKAHLAASVDTTEALS